MPDGGSVVVAHGLWMTGLEATLLRRRLADRGYAVRQFHYRSMTAMPEDVLAELRAEVLALPPPVHLVGHSLGGLLLLRFGAAHPELPLGRMVLLGSPVNGSRAARAFAALPGASLFFGHLAGSALLATGRARWQGTTAVGVIAGNHSLGFGRFIGHLPEPNDGTVSVDETELDGAADHLVLPVSHTGLLVSEEVVEATVRFLSSGRFAAPAP
ncbi:MAG TPA: alpha/beta fold hydrolase [Steroidobacteraceae bacterium]|nr:alpha/beta fold hydrolase [Steroidobacteraceae bacterium]